MHCKCQFVTQSGSGTIRELMFKTTGILGEEWSKWSMVVQDSDGLELFSFEMSDVKSQGTGA